ncbi:MAG: SgcJ/EcaC family oxidoreductase [Candidatus Bathyarchaeota archaeon]|nr:SgcJ/EcaC family oxidoreductase [Candidatus Bathyarchaeota archaeon]MDH5779440.1 SgcJ/EcaC family oxidoreductase [Candidatus Bathyarchaeota archaeon]
MRDIEADITAIKEIWNQYTSACGTGDLDRWISLWTDNGIQMPPDTPARIGKEEIREKMKPLFDQFIIKIPITSKEIRVAGDLAFSRGTYTLSTTPKAGGEATRVTGKYLTILERQADGSWKIARDCFNYNAPPTSPEKE